LVSISHLMLRSEGDRLTRVVVCTPVREYFRIEDLGAHNIGAVAGRERALEQHDALKSVLRDFGCEVIDVPELDGHPNSVFTRDTAVCTPRGYVKVRMGLETRRGEEEWMARVLDGLGEPRAGEIVAPGTVEGGDVILAGDVAFVGRSTRTNEEGIRQLAEILKDMGYEVRVAHVPHPFLHIGGAMTVVGDGTVLCCRGVFPPGFFRGFETIEIPAGSFISGNVIHLGDGEVIAEKSNRKAMGALRAHGYKIHELDLSEFVKGTGGPSCLIMPVERR